MAELLICYILRWSWWIFFIVKGFFLNASILSCLPLMSWLPFPASPLSCLPHGLSPLSCLLFVLPLPPPCSVTLRGVKYSEMLANAEVSCNFYITAQKLISWKYVLKNGIICQHILACYSGAKMAVSWLKKSCDKVSLKWIMFTCLVCILLKIIFTVSAVLFVFPTVLVHSYLNPHGPTSHPTFTLPFLRSEGRPADVPHSAGRFHYPPLWLRGRKVVALI